jgi:paraquat-inducible protein A
MSSFDPKHLHIIHECPDCGLMNSLATPVEGMDIACARCDNILRQVKKDSVDHGIVWASAALVFFMLAMVAPMLQVGIYGHYRSGAFETGPLTLDTQGYWMLAALIFMTTIIMPVIKIIGTLIVLGGIRFGYTPPWMKTLYALVKHLKPWVMVEVYLLGFLVAYSRLEVMATVHVALAAVGLVGLMLSMLIMDLRVDPEAVWEKLQNRQPVSITLTHEQIMGCDSCYQVSAIPAEQGGGMDCPRCGEVLHHRKPDSVARAWALTIGAALLYIPSNIFPVMTVTKLGKMQPYTIFTGLKELAHVGLWPLAVLVFIASIAIPIFKLAMMAYLLVETQRGSTRRLRGRTRLYRLLDFIGRWSMVDIFVVSILVALVRFGWFAEITAGAGGIYFSGVVVLTLLAVKSFDPRLMWDAACQKRTVHLTLSPSPSRLAT